MTLPSRHSIRNSNRRARYFSVTEALHNIESLRVSREETYYFMQSGFEPGDLQLSKQAALALQTIRVILTNMMHICFIKFFLS